MCLVGLILATVAYIPDQEWNGYLQKIMDDNKLEAYFKHAEYYITLDKNAYKENKKEYDDAQTRIVVDGYIRTLKPVTRDTTKGSLPPFGTLEKLKGEMYVRAKELLLLEKKEVGMQIGTIAMLAFLGLVTLVELILCFMFSTSKPIFKPLVRNYLSEAIYIRNNLISIIFVHSWAAALPPREAILWESDLPPRESILPPGGIFNSPGGNSDSPEGDYSDSPGGISDLPEGDYSDTPGGISDSPGGISDSPGVISDSPEGNSDSPKLPPFSRKINFQIFDASTPIKKNS